MLNALRSARPQQQQKPLILFSNSLPNRISRARPSSGIRFAQDSSRPTNHPGDKMDSEKQSKPESKTVDAMSSFGEAYATRSDEEGFGGIYGGNQYNGEDKKTIHEDAAEFDHNQGSEVKEKEKARHQNKVAS